MVPMRRVAAFLNVPLGFDGPTTSFICPSPQPNTVRIVPLPTARTGIVIHTPRNGNLSTKSIEVRGQANLPDEQLVVQVRTLAGKVLHEQKVTLSPGSFNEFFVAFLDARSEGGSEPLDVIAFGENKKGVRLHQAVVHITLRYSDGKP